MGTTLPTAASIDFTNYGIGTYDGYCEFVLRADTAAFQFGGLAALAASAVIDWGDGSAYTVKSSFTSTAVSHTYATQTADKVLRVWLKGFKPTGSSNPNSSYANELYTPQDSTKQIKAIRKYIVLNPDVTAVYWLFGCSSATTGYCNLEEIGSGAIHLPTVTNGSTTSWLHTATGTANTAYLKKIGDYAINLTGITGALRITGSTSSSYYGAFRNIANLASVGRCFLYAPNATTIELGKCFYGTKAVLGQGAFSSFGANRLYPGQLGAGLNVQAGAFQSFDSSEIHLGSASSSYTGNTQTFSEYDRAIRAGTFVAGDESKMFFGGGNTSGRGAFYGYTYAALPVGTFVANGSAQLHFGADGGSSAYGAFNGHTFELPKGVFANNDSSSSHFGAQNSSSTYGGAFYGYTFALPAEFFIVNSGTSLYMGGSGSSAKGAFAGYAQALPSWLFLVDEGAVLNLGGSGSSSYGAFGAHTQSLPAALVIGMDNATLNFGGHGTSGGGAFTSYALELTVGLFSCTDNAVMNFGGAGAGLGAFYNHSKAIPAGFLASSGSQTFNFGGNGTTNAKGAFYGYGLNLTEGMFVSTENSRMIFGGMDNGDGAFYGWSQVIAPGAFQAKGSSAMTFGGPYNFSSGAFGHYSTARECQAGAFTAEGSAAMSFGGHGPVGAGAFAQRRWTFAAGSFVVKGNAVMNFGAEKGTGAFYGSNAVFEAGAFKAIEDGTLNFGRATSETAAASSGAFAGAIKEDGNLSSAASQLFALEDNGRILNVSCAFYNAGITDILPAWWMLSPAPDPHDLCFFGNDDATNISSVPAGWK
jgi:hypothetical protein